MKNDCSASKACALVLLISLTSSACSDNGDPAPPAEAVGASAGAASLLQPLNKAEIPKTDEGYRTIEWTDLIPPDDLEALLNPPDYLEEIEDGSEEDQLDNQLALTDAERESSPYYQALNSTRVISEFDDQWVRIPGFIVPLGFDDNQKITSFFLVPFFGACIHLPPPPPNQMIYAQFDAGITVDALYDAFWITGLLQTTLVENEMASSAYAMTVTGISPYEDY